jgi:hypothetical protein
MIRGRRALLVLGLVLATALPCRAALGPLVDATDATHLRGPAAIGALVCTAAESAGATAATVARPLDHACVRPETATAQAATHARLGRRQAGAPTVPGCRLRRPTARSAPADPAAAS